MPSFFKNAQILIFMILSSLYLSSCGITKCRYSNGFNIELNLFGKKQNENQKESKTRTSKTQIAQKNESILFEKDTFENLKNVKLSLGNTKVLNQMNETRLSETKEFKIIEKKQESFLKLKENKKLTKKLFYLNTAIFKPIRNNDDFWGDFWGVLFIMFLILFVGGMITAFILSFNYSALALIIYPSAFLSSILAFISFMFWISIGW